MFGLLVSGENEMVENMIRNSAYSLNTYGHFPKGNRIYCLSGSQPSYFSMMLDLLADLKGKQVYALYQNAMLKEHDYNMDRIAATKRVVQMPGCSISSRY